MILLIVLLSVISASAFLRSDAIKQDVDTIAETNLIGHDSGIVSKVNVESDSIEVADDWDYYETVLIDSEKLNNSAKEGNINLTLMDKGIDIIIQKSDERPGSIWYKGFADGNPDYNVDISIRGDEVYGSVTTYGRGYNIYPTDLVFDGKLVHLVVASDILDTRSIEEKYPIDPLTFEIVNEDNIMHDFAIQAVR